MSTLPDPHYWCSKLSVPCSDGHHDSIDYEYGPQLDIFTAYLEEYANGRDPGGIDNLSGFDHLDEACQDAVSCVKGQLR